MKSKEEIEKIATNKYGTSIYSIDEVEAFKEGYTQCQEDSKDKKYTEEDVINLMSMATKWDTFKDGDVEYGMDMDSFFKYLINSLNKQD